MFKKTIKHVERLSFSKAMSVWNSVINIERNNLNQKSVLWKLEKRKKIK